MINVNIKEKISFNEEVIDKDKFMYLAKLMALKKSPDGNYHLGNFWRGPLLYSLVHHYKPRNVLEFGTGRGYGTICMAQAAHNIGLDCTIWTIDMVPIDQGQSWAIDEGSGPRIEKLSLKDVWAKHIPRELTQHIHCLTGDSVSVMREWFSKGQQKVDFCFIDGGHDYLTVKHDFMAALKVANKECSFLFDDYTQRKRFGVRHLIDREVNLELPEGGVEIIDTLSRDKTDYGEDVPHEMALLRGEYIRSEPLQQFYTKTETILFKIKYPIYFSLLKTYSRLRSLL